MWVWSLLKFVAIIIVASGVVGAISLVGYLVWSAFQPKAALTAEDTEARQQKYQTTQIRRRWYDTTAAIIVAIGAFIEIGSHRFSWWTIILPISLCVIAVNDWLMTLSHHRSEPTEPKQH